MGDGMLGTDLGELERIASSLRGGASSLDGPSQSAPEAPDAGGFSGLIAGKLTEVAGAVLAIHEDLEQMANQIAQSRGQYHETDLGNAGRFQPPH